MVRWSCDPLVARYPSHPRERRSGDQRRAKSQPASHCSTLAAISRKELRKTTSRCARRAPRSPRRRPATRCVDAVPAGIALDNREEPLRPGPAPRKGCGATEVHIGRHEPRERQKALAGPEGAVRHLGIEPPEERRQCDAELRLGRLDRCLVGRGRKLASGGRGHGAAELLCPGMRVRIHVACAGRCGGPRQVGLRLLEAEQQLRVTEGPRRDVELRGTHLRSTCRILRPGTEPRDEVVRGPFNQGRASYRRPLEAAMARPVPRPQQPTRLAPPVVWHRRAAGRPVSNPDAGGETA
jgi:hypothetical protein